MFAWKQTSSGMEFGAVITLGITLGFITCLVDRIFFYSWRSYPLAVCMLLGKIFLTNSVVSPGQYVY